MRRRASQCGLINRRFFFDFAQIYEEENTRLEASGESTRSQMEAMAAMHDTQRRMLEALNAQLLDKIHELTRLHRDISAALET